MNWRIICSRILKVVGSLSMLIGTVDPLEGSLLILLGGGLVTLGIFLAGKKRGTVLYWTCAFLLIGVGVGAMFVLSAYGGIGGRSGRSLWWGVFMVPYPVGWLMALAGGIVGLLRFVKNKWAAHA